MIDLSPLFGSHDAPEKQNLAFRVFPRSGAERWMIESNQKRPWHLKTWPRASFRARLIHQGAWALGTVGLHLPHRSETFSIANDSPYGQLRDQFDQLGIFLGTPGPNRKIVVYAGRVDRSIFVKIPLRPESAALVAREAEALQTLANDACLGQLVPKTTWIAGQLALDDIEGQGVTHAELDISEVARIQALLERRSSTKLPLQALKSEWAGADEAASAHHSAEEIAALKRARDAALSFLSALPEDSQICCYMAHGDLTRWNVLRAADGTARIIDWEMFGLKPRWFDLLHYVVSYHILVARTPAADILKDLQGISHTIGAAQNLDAWWRYVGLYFAYQSLYYGGVYTRQERLHPQAMWQLIAWAEILDLVRNRLAA